MAYSLTTCKLIPTLFFNDLSFLCSFIFSHPLYFSYFIFFSPYLFRFIFFISPLFLTTSLVLILSLIATTFPHSKLGFLQSIVDKCKLKLNDVDQDDGFRDFEDFEIYKIVFDGPPLLTVGEADDKQSSYTVTKSEEQRSLERLFEELDRFEAYNPAIEMKEIGELRKLVPVSDEDQKTVESLFSVNSDSWRSESSSSFGSCGSVEDETTTFEMKNETRSHVGKVIGELQKSAPVKVSYSGDDQKTVKTTAFDPIEVKNSETTAHVRKVLQKLEPAVTSVSGKTVISNETTSHVRKALQKLEPAVSISETVRSNSTAAIEVKNIKTTSHVQKVLQKLEPMPMSISIEDQKPVKPNSTAVIETKNSETETETTSHARKALQKSISGEDQKSVKPNSTAAIERKTSETETTSCARKVLQKSVYSEDQKTVTPSSTENGETTSYARKVLQKSISSEDQTPVQNSFSRSNSWRMDSSSRFGSYGSMRKEKEWKRTLACKLFEERNSSGGEEGMDSLWEAYEEDNNKKSKIKTKTMMKNKKKSEFKYFDDGEDEEDDEEDEIMSNGQLCCLKALKLSTGKMNLGMGKPNLVKISKAIKGFGWLHHVGSKNGKKK